MDSNLTVHKINASRYNLKKYLQGEWDVSTIIDYSDVEIEKLYTSPKPVNTDMQFGSASGCDFSVYHKKLIGHRCHVIYYNFPEIGKPAVKINKTCSDKLNNLYKDEIIAPEDSLIIILYNPVSDNLEKSVENLYLNGQETLKAGVSDSMKKVNDELNENQYSICHFRNIHIHHLDSLAIDIMSHVKVPDHAVIRDQPNIDSILEKCNARINQLPVILRSDPVAKRLRIAPGDICVITRLTQTAGETQYYRVCR
jgi:DNA-directed RNA polymerase subunit H (RpoH/RPB5)